MMILSWPQLASELALLAALVLIFKLSQTQVEALITNKMRYGRDELKSSNSILIEQMLDNVATTASISTSRRPSSFDKKYSTNLEFHEDRLLDDEDKSLLEEFYRKTKEGNPFIDSISTESLWNDEESNGLNALIDLPSAKSQETNPISKGEKSFESGWSIEPNYKKSISEQAKQNYNVPTTSIQSSYSPTLKLLTSYNPIESFGLKLNTKGEIIPQVGDRIVGATLYGEGANSKPGVSSKSSQEAIRLHDELLKEPPRDGKVRVRMYYHRAIHDDARLYGTGPWKYWGHGWGLEFGYRPDSAKKDFYQKGYTIERAFGRDFCKDKKNCRKPDPNFFNDPKNVGRYGNQKLNYK